MLQSEEIYDLYCSPYTIWVIKSRRMRCLGHVAHMGRGEVHSGLWWGNMRKRDNLEVVGLNKRIILKGIFEKWNGVISRIDLAQHRDR
jgi:hypothetical protein